jgi:hypothetical protein
MHLSIFMWRSPFNSKFLSLFKRRARKSLRSKSNTLSPKSWGVPWHWEKACCFGECAKILIWPDKYTTIPCQEEENLKATPTWWSHFEPKSALFLKKKTIPSMLRSWKALPTLHPTWARSLLSRQSLLDRPTFLLFFKWWSLKTYLPWQGKHIPQYLHIYLSTCTKHNFTTRSSGKNKFIFMFPISCL